MRDLRELVKRDIRLYYLDTHDKLVLRFSYEELKGSIYNASASSNSFGSGCPDDKTLKLLIKLDEMKKRLDEIEMANKALERALCLLSDEDRDIVVCLWGERVAVEELARRYNYSSRSIYNHAYKALDELVFTIYGK